MSGTPEWKQGHRARPSTLVGNQSPDAGQHSAFQQNGWARVSPSCIDLSGRHEHAPVTSRILDSSRAMLLGVPKRAICDKATRDEALRSDDRKVRQRTGGIFGGASREPDPEADLAVATAAPGNFTAGQLMLPPAVPSALQVRPHTGVSIDEGWHVGAYFRCIIRMGLAHRIYEGPPDGTQRLRIGPEEVHVDFSRPYKIRAIFVNDVYLAVQFKVPTVLNMSGFVRPGMNVWTNVRRGDEWWARLVDASVAQDLINPTGADNPVDELLGLPWVTVRRLELAPSTAPGPVS